MGDEPSVADPAAREQLTDGEMSGNTSPKTAKHPPPAHAGNDSNSPSPDSDIDDDDETKPTLPIQKRRRVTRACDECRRKKIKCDGKQPCTHCTVYSYECTYDQPSNRRRNPAPQYIEALEQRLTKAEAILRMVLPGIDLEDPTFDAHSVDQLVETARRENVGLSRQAQAQGQPSDDDDAQMQSMVDQTGKLDLDDTGRWDFHGHESGYVFMDRFRAKFGQKFIPVPRTPENRNLNHVLESPKSMQSSPWEHSGVLPIDLPPREIAIEYCRNAIDDGCALSRPIHRPSFFKRLHALYDADPEHYDTEQMRFLPLLYVVMALGCLFANGETDNVLDKRGYQGAIEQGYQYFNASKTMIDITDCRDLTSLQTMVFMIFFLQGSAKLATCYSYIGIALRACCRLGMHRKVTNSFSVIQQEERKRVFWLVRKMDTYVGTMLGLPQMLADSDIDQEMPAEVHDDYIKDDGIAPMPLNVFPLIKATNAHTRLMTIMKKVLQYVYPLKTAGSSQLEGHGYAIGHSRIRELERDLQAWMDQLPLELRPSDTVDLELSRAQQLLRMSYAYVQMMIYRPFLHYVSPGCQNRKVDKRSFACAAACVSVARNIVHITSEMRRRGLLGGAYWFVMYITYFAILALVYFVLENPDSHTSKAILEDAREGQATLQSLAKRSFAADRCTQSLYTLFEELPEKLRERRSSTPANSTVSRKRSQPTDAVPSGQTAPGSKATQRAMSTSTNNTSGRGRAMPAEFVNRMAKRGSIPPSSPTSASSQPSSFNASNESRHNMANSTFGTPANTSTPGSQLDWSMPQMQQGNFPDLKNVMFPSDNPFAYGNQAISTLEESAFGGLQESGFGTDPNYSPRQGVRSFTNPNFGSHQQQPPHQQQQQHQQQHSQQQQQRQRHSIPIPRNGGFSQPDPANLYDGGSGLVDEPGSMLRGEEYWTNAASAVDQQAKSQFRTGLTPGIGPNVDLNDLFGNADIGVSPGNGGWGPMNLNITPTMEMNMGMDMNLLGGGGTGSAPGFRQEGNNMAWASDPSTWR